MDGDDAGPGFWAAYDNAFTRWLGWQQADRSPDLYADAAFRDSAAGLIDALPDVDLGAGEEAIVTRLLAGETVPPADAMPYIVSPAIPEGATPEDIEALLATAADARIEDLQAIADMVPQADVDAAAGAAQAAGDAYAAHLAEGANPVVWFLSNLLESLYNIAFAVTHPGMWLDWSDPVAMMRFIYYGASVELMFALLLLALVLTTLGMVWNGMMWSMVRGLEGVANTIGRIAAWAGFIMVIQQIVIIFMQRVFAVAELSFGFGMTASFPISWWSEELKLYNAIVVTLCIAWTFVQGGHVRVDLVYSKVSFGAKRVIDMMGALFFMIPAGLLIWLYAWFFLWRNLVVPNPSASDRLEQLLNKARALRWNVETIGFSPNGFNAYFLFKVLLLIFTAMMMLQALAFFWRSYLEWREGPASEGKYLDRDPIDDEVAEIATAAH